MFDRILKIHSEDGISKKGECVETENRLVVPGGEDATVINFT